jgi:hypothetical protein
MGRDATGDVYDHARNAYRGGKLGGVIMGDSPASGVPLKDLTPSQYSRISELLDEAIDMALEEREAWLAEIERSDLACALILRDLFASQDGSRCSQAKE